MENASIDGLYAKISRYCAYQERSSGEVRQKLRLLGADGKTSERLLARLREDNFLSDERFVSAYIRGKIRINGWGRLKIQYGLRAKGIEEHLIQKALKTEINADEYMALLRKTIEEKGPKTALSRGFEPSEVYKFSSI